MKAQPAEDIIRHIAILLVLVLGLFWVSPDALAHKVTENQGVTALVHVSPDDNPVAGDDENSQISFDISGANIGVNSHSFNLIVLEPDGTNQELYAFLEGESSIVSTLYSFPVVGDYTFTLSGESLDGGRPFEITHDQTVTRTVNDGSYNGILVISLVAVGLGASLLVTVLALRPKPNTKPKAKKYHRKT